MANKVCPRCGSQYATLKSATCPQCFALLIEVDDDTAAQMAAERSQVEKSPEFQAAKAEDDERFRHQSFQACLVAVAMGFVLLVVTIVMVVSAKHDRDRLAAKYAHMQAVKSAAATHPTTVQAKVEDVMPPQVGGFHREKMDQRAALSGTVNLIYHAAYVPVAKSVTIDVYATTLDRSAAELDRFRDVVQLAAMAGSGQRSVTEVSAKPFLYEIVGVPGTPGVNAAFQQALTSQVGGR